MSIIDFLEARIAEDEGRAQDADCGRIADGVNRSIGCYSTDLLFVSRFDPARVLAECAAKRDILEMYHTSEDGTIHADAWMVMKLILAVMARPYAGHVDFDPAWKIWVDA